MGSKKRRRAERPTIHPRNKYSENPPDFSELASLYPSFRPFVFLSSRTGRPAIDWTDFNATRELTRVLLHRDHAVNWWIPDGQLCPTISNRSNYIHWIEDLLSSELIPSSHDSDHRVRGFDIGTGANCIYPLLGASLLGWSFVGSDVTAVALEWARKNVESNPHLSELIEIRKASSSLLSKSSPEESGSEDAAELASIENPGSLEYDRKEECYQEPPVLINVVRDGEEFDFCMCNPPFFESIEEAGLNPRTACGGTTDEMVCPGGELAFVTRIIEDSVTLKHSFRWFTSMVGKKSSLKFLISKLRKFGVSIVKTTEFVQGRTARWGLAWSFILPSKKLVAITSNAPRRNNHSFTLEIPSYLDTYFYFLLTQGLPRQFGASQVLKSLESFFLANGASCKTDFSSFSVNVTICNEQTGIKDGRNGETATGPTSNESNNLQCSFAEISFSVSVYEQIPGTLLVKGVFLDKENPLAGMFMSLLLQLEEALKKEFLNKLSRR
ncbi:methyltransferase-like protein 16-like protein isoform X1 [Iris pallida]|uniref:U6 small nuclear RNA (adenine-(43)-N(6))-methyltransferase n=1 Tax=Iris pallida TaxID=29817 RepID=A0AAX6ETW6_IRIPA|nr:methyltransferase-like protein 16-like protein isoform X1 [Iris pallida]KAJ6840438.1 methyltransferase-like protein 16-like protein isoform X1 [Iris pallida]